MYDGGVITSQVTVSVTNRKEQQHLVSWLFLWLGYLLATIACGVQVQRDRKSRIDVSDASDSGQATANNREGNDSSGESTRSMFYGLLCFALFSRSVLIPAEIFASSVFWNLVAETFPEIAFASAWTLFVSFLVQLVGTASGDGTFTRPSLIIQTIVYAIYLALALTAIWNDDASVLLYAVLCSIYAALLLCVLYFGPRLLAVLQPSLARRSGLAIRLVSCCLICVMAFAARTVDLARQVVAPPEHHRWWMKYGAIELFPASALLLMMHPNRGHPAKSTGTGPGTSFVSNEASAPRRAAPSKRGETLPLIKPTVMYGTPSLDS